MAEGGKTWTLSTPVYLRRGLLAFAFALALIASAVAPLGASARPTDAAAVLDEPKYSSGSRHSCVPTRYCIHWVVGSTTSDPDRLASYRDGNGNGVPDVVDGYKALIKKSWDTEVVNLGYRAPLRDKGTTVYPKQGPNVLTDVYLADVGGESGGQIEGYCRDDLPSASTAARAPAYCVLDEDFGPEFEFSTWQERSDELRVTVAHEFFHAIQSAYDRSTPGWFSEGTATWMEGVVFPSITVSDSYLDASALHQPEVPIDSADGDSRYGAWVFWRFIAERYGGAAIKNLWGWASLNPTGNDLRGALRLYTGESSFNRLLSTFAVWNYGVGNDNPKYYADGDRYLARLGGQRPPLDALYALSSTRTTTATATSEYRLLRVDHMSTRYARFRNDCGRPVAMTLTLQLPTSASADDASLLRQAGSASGATFGARIPMPLIDGNRRQTMTVSLADSESVILALSNGNGIGQLAYEYKAQIPANCGVAP